MRTARDDCLSHLILFGEASLRRALTELLAHYHEERNHQGVGNVLLFPNALSPEAPSLSTSEGKDKTFDKNAAQLEVEAGVDEVSSRGVMAFRKEPQVRALFEALVSSSGPKPKASDAPTPPTT